MCVSHQVTEICCRLIYSGCPSSVEIVLFVVVFVTREKISAAADECGGDIKFIINLERMGSLGSSPHLSRETASQNFTGSSRVRSGFKVCISPTFTVDSRHSLWMSLYPYSSSTHAEISLLMQTDRSRYKCSFLAPRYISARRLHLDGSIFQFINFHEVVENAFETATVDGRTSPIRLWQIIYHKFNIFLKVVPQYTWDAQTHQIWYGSTRFGNPLSRLIS